MSSLVVRLNGVPTLRERQNWEALELRFMGWETRLSPDTRLSPHVFTTLNLVVLRQRMYAQIEGNPEIEERLDLAPLGWGVTNP